ncbi:MAG: flavodoxin-dependent (E)-4-hydroxy-3-methylbut-2-enyl-diphosphate synthase [Lentisphaeria bacterium]|nr:flavodoxin-dependent (E)-4-hydroxy-3-methylbut-2-enyl-diphosphate synthase [Lentisphaeria bacterium]
MRRNTRNFFLGPVGIGHDHPVSIQSMCNTRTADVRATVAQIESLAACGCDIIRVSADNPQDVAALKQICQVSPIPVIADIQFSGESALGAISGGCAGIRVNPGIIHDRKLLREIAAAAVIHGTVIRVGANGGSLKLHRLPELLAGGVSREDAMAQLLCEAVLQQCEMLSDSGVSRIKAAVKSSDLSVTLKAYRKLGAACDLPLHLGLTEAGTAVRGELRSAIAIGALLTEGIGDTVRVSLTAAPEAEIAAAKRILDVCGMGKESVEIVSCPTCGRTEVDLIGLAGKVEELIARMRQEKLPVRWKKIAVMGCPVNGPGEARSADIGIAGSRNGQLIIFQNGKVTGAYPEAEAWAIFTRMLSGGDDIPDFSGKAQ